LHRIAPLKLLKDYTIEFLGKVGSSYMGYVRKIRELAREKGIKIKIYGEVDKDKLFTRVCMGRGIVMMSIDKNPRAVYEAVQAGLPVFVASEAQCATDLTSQPFVVETSIVEASRDPTQFNEDLRSYVGMIGRDWSWDLATWARVEMTDESVYTGLCQRMGVCEAGKKSYEPWFGPVGELSDPALL
jgi:hypothetical protein